MTKHPAALALVALALAGVVCGPAGQGAPSGSTGAPGTPQPAATALPATYKDISIEVEGQSVALVNGAAETAAAPGSATKIVTRYFGNDAVGDLNGDGAPDVAFLITQTRGGSGTFFYVVVALKTASGYAGTNAVLLGDRIAPQPTQITAGQLVVSYADRKAGEPMTTTPSVGMSKYLKVVGGRLQAAP